MKPYSEDIADLRNNPAELDKWTRQMAQDFMRIYSVKQKPQKARKTSRNTTLFPGVIQGQNEPPKTDVLW